MKKIIFLFILVLSAITIAKAQFRNNDFKSFSIKVGAAIPTSGFEKKDNFGAVSGLGLNFRYFQPITSFGLGVYGEVATFLNTTTDSYKNRFKAFLDLSTGESGTFSIDYPAYTTVPLSAGVALQYDIGKFSVLADAGFLYGFTIFKNQEYDSPSIENSTTTSTYKNYGFKSSAGLMFNKVVSITLGYYYIKESKDVDVTSKTRIRASGREAEVSGKRRAEIGIINVALGIHF